MSEPRGLAPEYSALLTAFQVEIRTCELLIQGLTEKLLTAQAQLDTHHATLYEGNGHPGINTTLRVMETSLHHMEVALGAIPGIQTLLRAVELAGVTAQSGLTSMQQAQDGIAAWHEKIHLTMDAPKLEALKAAGAARVALISAGFGTLTALLVVLVSAWLKK